MQVLFRTKFVHSRRVICQCNDNFATDYWLGKCIRQFVAKCNLLSRRNILGYRQKCFLLKKTSFDNRQKLLLLFQKLFTLLKRLLIAVILKNSWGYGQFFLLGGHPFLPDQIFAKSNRWSSPPARQIFFYPNTALKFARNYHKIARPGKLCPTGKPAITKHLCRERKYIYVTRPKV